MEMSLKTGFAQIFSRCPKNLSCPKFGGAAAPLAPPPPARTPMMKTAKGVEGEGFANFVHVVVYFKLFFSEIRSIMENPSYNEKDNIIYTEGIY